jgi:hypothetical protein
MTPEEQYAHFHNLCSQIIDSVLRAAREAGREEERKACAQIARAWLFRYETYTGNEATVDGNEIADQIEARSQEATPDGPPS